MGALPRIPMRPEELPQQRLSLVVPLPPRPTGFAGTRDAPGSVPPSLKMPRSARYIGQVEWAWSMINARLDAYYLSTNRARTGSCGCVRTMTTGGAGTSRTSTPTRPGKTSTQKSPPSTCCSTPGRRTSPNTNSIIFTGSTRRRSCRWRNWSPSAASPGTGASKSRAMADNTPARSRCRAKRCQPKSRSSSSSRLISWWAATSARIAARVPTFSGS